MDRNDVLDSLAKDEDFLKKVIESKTANDVKKLFAEKGVDVSDDDLNTLKQIFLNTVSKMGKISDDESLDISGGKAKWYNVARGIAGIAVTAAAGCVIYTMKTANDAINQGMDVMNNANDVINQGMGVMNNANDAINQGMGVMNNANAAISQGMGVMNNANNTISNVNGRIDNISGGWLGKYILRMG